MIYGLVSNEAISMEYCTGINLPLSTMSPLGVIASDLVILNSPLFNEISPSAASYPTSAATLSKRFPSLSSSSLLAIISAVWSASTIGYFRMLWSIAWAAE